MDADDDVESAATRAAVVVPSRLISECFAPAPLLAALCDAVLRERRLFTAVRCEQAPLLASPYDAALWSRPLPAVAIVNFADLPPRPLAGSLRRGRDSLFGVSPLALERSRTPPLSAVLSRVRGIHTRSIQTALLSILRETVFTPLTSAYSRKNTTPRPRRTSTESREGRDSDESQKAALGPRKANAMTASTVSSSVFTLQAGWMPIPYPKVPEP